MSDIVDHVVLNMIPPIALRYSGRVTPRLTLQGLIDRAQTAQPVLHATTRARLGRPCPR